MSHRVIEVIEVREGSATRYFSKDGKPLAVSDPDRITMTADLVTDLAIAVHKSHVSGSSQGFDDCGNPLCLRGATFLNMKGS